MELKIKTRSQFMALLDALDQYVSNTEECHDTYGASEEEAAKLVAAREYMEALEGVLCTLAA